MGSWFAGAVTSALLAAGCFVAWRSAIGGVRRLRQQGVPPKRAVGRQEVRHARWAIAFATLGVVCLVLGVVESL